MTVTLPLAGAFALGLVLGWFTYFTNRYREGAVQFSDLATLFGIIGGAAATSLFGDAKGELFGAYGLGLATGFFLYFAVLVAFVTGSKSEFSLAYFVDGRRRVLPEGWEIPMEARRPVIAMATGLGSRAVVRPPPMRFAAFQLAGADEITAEAVRLRDRAIAAAEQGRRGIAEAIVAELDAAERQRLFALSAALDTQLDMLRAARMREINEAAADAVLLLQTCTTDLEREAKKIKAAADAYARATAAIDALTKVVGLVVGLAG